MMNATLISLSLLPWTAVASAEPRKPNVIVILADDLGWGELGFQGNRQIPTPHIDSIAKNGVRFTDGYVSGPYCSPTRAGLMTGRYQTRFGHEFNSTARQSGLSLQEKTIADRLKPLGYATAAVGKWHLGQAPEYRPARRGFDEFFGTLANTPYYHPTNFVDSRVSTEIQEISDDSFYSTEKYADRAVDWIERHKDQPYFLYLALNAQHAPLQAPKKYLDRFASIQDENRRAFAAVLSAADDAVGRVLDKLKELGQEDDTLLFYLTDNGGPTRSTTSSNGPLRGFKAQTWEGGVRVPFAVQWKGRIPAGKTYSEPVIQLDILPTILSAAGAPIDPSWKLDGVDVLPFLTGKSQGAPHQSLYWRFGDQWAIRHGDWKLVVGAGSGPGSNPSKEPELYNLRTDLGESKNLAAAEPEQVKDLLARWQAWNAEQAPASTPKEKPQARNKGAQKKGKGKAKNRAANRQAS